MGGHGYTVVRATTATFDTEFVCIPRPIQRSDRPDGGPLAYRVRHSANLWTKSEPPSLNVKVLEGDPRFSL
jgi:alkaline phosphatase D